MCSVLLSEACGCTAAAAAGPWRMAAACLRKARLADDVDDVPTRSTLPMTPSPYTELRSAWAMALVVVITSGDPVPTAWLPSVRTSGCTPSASTVSGYFGAGLQIGSSAFGG